MLEKTGFLFLILLFIISCKKQEIKTDIAIQQRDSIAFSQKKAILKSRVKLLPKTKKETDNWKEYQIFDAFIQQFYTISNAEALSNAQELSELSTHLKDSIIDEKLKKPAVKTRFNILQNECLRLMDMDSIPSITHEEVQIKIGEVLIAYDAVNAKLNSVYVVENFENNLQLDPDFKKILFESGIDTISPKKEKNKGAKYDRKLSAKKRKNKPPTNILRGIPSSHPDFPKVKKKRVNQQK